MHMYLSRPWPKQPLLRGVHAVLSSHGAGVPEVLGLCPTVMENETTDGRGRVEANSFKSYKGKKIRDRKAGT